MKAANPITVEFKPAVTLHRKTQYSLKQEAGEEIQKTVEGLISAGVLMKTCGPCNNLIIFCQCRIKSNKQI